MVVFVNIVFTPTFCQRRKVGVYLSSFLLSSFFFLLYSDEDERLKAAEQRLIATGSQVNVAEQRLKDTQSQGDDSPATPLRLTSSSAAINRSEAAHPLTAPL